MAKLDDRRANSVLIEESNLKTFVGAEINRTVMTFFALLACPRELFIENKKGLLLMAFTIGYAVYLSLGGILFLVIEGPQENVELNNMMTVKSNVMSKYPNVPGEAIDELFEELTSNGVKGIVMENSTAKWTYGNAVLFSATLLTTIGYGHLAPMSPLGKIVCMFYTGMGIPMTLLLLAQYVERLLSLSEHFKINLFRRFGGMMKPSNIRLIHIATIMAFIVVGCFIIPAWIFCWLEMKWTYLDAIYFCFISLTTVGLGDFVPGLIVNHPYIDLYRFGATLYIIIGVTIMMFMMALTADFIHNYNKGYEELLPLVITHEKAAVKSDQKFYGSIEVHKQEPRDQNENNLLMP